MSDEVRVTTVGESYRWKCPRCWRQMSRPKRGEHPSFKEIARIKNEPLCKACARRDRRARSE